MLLIPALLCLALFLFGLWSMYKTTPARNWLLHPAVGFGLLNVLTLGLRGLTSNQWLPALTSTATQQEVLYYNVAFFFLYFVALHITILFTKSKRRLEDTTPIKPKWKKQIKTSMILLAGLLFVSLVLGTYFGIFHSLGQEAKTQNLGFIDTGIRLGFETRWVLAGLCIAAINRFPKYSWLFLAFVLMSETLMTVQHGGRGHVFTAFRVLCAAMAYHSRLGQGIIRILYAKSKYIVPLGVSAFILIFIVTAMREKKAYDDNVISFSAVSRSASSLADKSWDELGEPLEAMVLRLSYPYDNHGLVIMARQNKRPKRNYKYGSFPDALKFVPRVIWKDKPTSTFNYWMSEYLLGRRGGNTFDLPIGRVSEADYIFGMPGIFLGVFYGVLFGWWYAAFFEKNNKIVWKIVYVALFFGYIMAGAACMTNRIPILMQVFVCTFPLLFWMRKVKL